MRGQWYAVNCTVYSVLMYYVQHMRTRVRGRRDGHNAFLSGFRVLGGVRWGVGVLWVVGCAFGLLLGIERGASVPKAKGRWLMAQGISGIRVDSGSGRKWRNSGSGSGSGSCLGPCCCCFTGLTESLL